MGKRGTVSINQDGRYREQIPKSTGSGNRERDSISRWSIDRRSKEQTPTNSVTENATSLKAAFGKENGILTGGD